MSLEMMTYEFLLAPPDARKAAKQASLRSEKIQAYDIMPDNKGVGWRKKIQSKPKELQPLKLGTDNPVGADDSSDRRRHHGWRKTIQGSRPATPATGLPTTPTVDETEAAHVERAEPCTLHQDSKPKLIRYTSLFSGFNNTPKGPEFSQPWGEEALSFEPYVDPKVAISSIRAHMASFSMKPIPLEHNNNLFCIFEDYHKRRYENERLDVALHETREKLGRAEDQWAKDERQYAEEIRRLELLIAQGATGVAGLLNARQGTVLDRKHKHRKTISNSRPTTWNEFLTQEQIDTEIKSRSQQVLLQRSTSPSMKMTALSRQFTGREGADLRVGTPPLHESKPMLSRKVQSELNLNILGRIDTAKSIAHSSVASGFLGGARDPLPDEMSSPMSALVEMTVDCDATIALRELGTLVARRRGLETATFVEGFMMLLSSQQAYDSRADNFSPFNTEDLIMKESTPQRTLRRYQSQPQLSSDQKRRRHFSFEPGEDLLQASNEEFTEADASPLYGNSSEMVTHPVINNLREANSPGGSTSTFSGTQQDPCSVSKIPSPVQVYGSVRREGSISSQRSVMAKLNDSRHNSQSSILTAFQDSQSANLRRSSSSRSSSFITLRSAGSPARITTKLSTTSSLRGTRVMGLHPQENGKPKKSG